MSDVEIAERLAVAWRRSLERFYDGRPHCIEATKYALEALRRLGVRARPLPCGIVVANVAGDELAERDVPVSEWPAHAWGVGVDPDGRLDGPGWDGHLIVAGDGWLADYSGYQFARPKPGRIDVHAWAARTPEGFDAAAETPIRMTDGDVVIRVWPRPKLARWRSSNAWRSPIVEASVVELLEAFREPETADG